MGDVIETILIGPPAILLIPPRDMADKHPEASVKGIDVSPIQPFWTPPNARFEMDDFNLRWEDHEKYDLIHGRELLGCVPDWKLFYENCFRLVLTHTRMALALMI